MEWNNSIETLGWFLEMPVKASFFSHLGNHSTSLEFHPLPHSCHRNCLLSRFFEINSGGISIDGRDIRAVSKSKLRRSLIQKNNAFVIRIALIFLNPLMAMGPTFYILYHNLYNSWQIYRFERRRSKLIC